MFPMASERDTQFAAEAPAFVAEIQRIFSAAEIAIISTGAYEAPRTAYPNLVIKDLDDEIEDESRQENPVMGAKELLRFPPPAPASPAGALITAKLAYLTQAHRKLTVAI